MTSFRDFLQDLHAASYRRSDDNMPDAFDEWYEDMTDEELVENFELYIQKYPIKVVAKEIYNLI
jgi:hypothetical protein